MKKAIIGKKIGMTQIFDENGKVIPVTVVQAGPCVVSQKKTVETDGYNALQLGYGDIRPKLVNKPLKGHFDKSDIAPKKTLREFRFADISAYNVGDIIKADVFESGEKVDVTGTSKGNAGTSDASKKLTVQVLLFVKVVPSELVLTLQEFSKERKCQDTLELKELQFKI